MKVYKKIIELKEENKRFALATVIKSQGSTPRESTAKMVIEEDGTITDTVGGGPVEKEVIEEALKAIEKGRSTLAAYKLNKELEDGLNMNCGGNMEVFIEVFNPKPTILLVGGGHVNYALSKLVDYLGYDLMVVDDREEFCNEERYPKAKNLLLTGDYTEDLKEFPITKNHYIVIATKNDDAKALEGVIKSSASYIGMIGSRRKVKAIFDDLLGKGYTKEDLEKVHSPMGLDINAETPEEIGISILGEIIKVINGGSGKSLIEMRGF
jgi:xanthine dehydrogenase accessory factor